MNFTREPIIETIITPKEGFKLVLRSSKGTGHEEFFVDALEVISFGNGCFYRSTEKPKPFIIPASDYEIVEVRETRVVLKTPSLEKGIKIGGGREASIKASPREAKEVQEEAVPQDSEAPAEARTDKRRERKRFRKKRGRDTEEEVAGALEAPFPEESVIEHDEEVKSEPTKPREERTLIPPPSTLISETLARYKDTPGYSGAFYEKKEEVSAESDEQEDDEAKGKRILLEESEEDFRFLAEETDTDFSENEEDSDENI